MSIYYYQQTYESPEILPLSDAKKQLKMEDFTFDDDIIYDCVEAAINEAETYTNRNIQERKFIVKSGSWLPQGYEFKQQTVSAITKITYKPYDGSADVELIDDALAAFIELLPVDPYAKQIFYKDYDNLPDLAEDVNDAVSFEITVGYSSGSVPFAIKQGIKLIVTDNYNFRGDRDKQYHSASRIKLEPYRYYPKYD
jgi:hypothetical protein